MMKGYSNPSFFQWIFYSTAIEATGDTHTHTHTNNNTTTTPTLKYIALYMRALYIAKYRRITCRVACDQ